MREYISYSQNSVRKEVLYDILIEFAVPIKHI
jgi:hypothetical protein